MRRRLLCLVGIVILGFAAPTGSAQSDSESLRIQVDADEMVFRGSDPVVGDDAADLREEIDDDYGNGDGTVQTNEVQAYEDDNRFTFDTDRPECFDDFDFVRIDGQPPRRLAEVREEIIGATNTRTTSTTTLQEVTVIHFAFPKPRSDQVTITVRLSQAGEIGGAASCSVPTFGSARSASAAYPGAPSDWPSSEPWPTGEGSTWNWSWDWSSYYPAGNAQQEPDMVFQIEPRGNAQILRDTIRPDSVRSLWDGRGIRADTDQETALLFNNQVTFTSRGGASDLTSFEGTARNVGAVIGYSTVGVASLAGVAILATEFGRYKFLKILFLIPGFSRLEKDEVLEHNKRDELYRFIKTTPGPSFSDLRRELGLSNGTLVHHLRILEAQEYVKPVRDGFRTRFYVRGPKIVPTSYLTRTQIQLLEAIGANPGLTQKELSLVLGLPRESVSYHTKQLAQKGKLEIKQDGKWRRYWPSTGPATSPPTAGQGL